MTSSIQPTETLNQYFQQIRQEVAEYIRLKDQFDELTNEYMNKKSCLDTLQTLAKENETEHISKLYSSLHQEHNMLISRKKEVEIYKDKIREYHTSIREIMKEMIQSYSTIDRVLFRPMSNQDQCDELLTDMANIVFPKYASRPDLRDLDSKCSKLEEREDSSSNVEGTWASNHFEYSTYHPSDKEFNWSDYDNMECAACNFHGKKECSKK